MWLIDECIFIFPSLIGEVDWRKSASDTEVYVKSRLNAGQRCVLNPDYVSQTKMYAESGLHVRLPKECLTMLQIFPVLYKRALSNSSVHEKCMDQ